MRTLAYHVSLIFSRSPARAYRFYRYLSRARFTLALAFSATPVPHVHLLAHPRVKFIHAVKRARAYVKIKRLYTRYHYNNVINYIIAHPVTLIKRNAYSLGEVSEVSDGIEERVRKLEEALERVLNELERMRDMITIGRENTREGEGAREQTLDLSKISVSIRNARNGIGVIIRWREFIKPRGNSIFVTLSEDDIRALAEFFSKVAGASEGEREGVPSRSPSRGMRRKRVKVVRGYGNALSRSR